MSEYRSRATAAEQNLLAPRPLNLGLETTAIGASSRSLAPRARGLGQAPRLRAAGAGEQCSQSLHRRAVDARAAEESTSTTTTMAESMHGCVAGFDSRPALTAVAGFDFRPGPTESCMRARGRAVRARARARRRLSLSLSCWPGVSPESETEQRIMRG